MKNLFFLTLISLFFFSCLKETKILNEQLNVSKDTNINSRENHCNCCSESSILFSEAPREDFMVYYFAFNNECHYTIKHTQCYPAGTQAVFLPSECTDNRMFLFITKCEIPLTPNGIPESVSGCLGVYNYNGHSQLITNNIGYYLNPITQQSFSYYGYSLETCSNWCN